MITEDDGCPDWAAECGRQARNQAATLLPDAQPARYPCGCLVTEHAPDAQCKGLLAQATERWGLFRGSCCAHGAYVRHDGGSQCPRCDGTADAAYLDRKAAATLRVSGAQNVLVPLAVAPSEFRARALKAVDRVKLPSDLARACEWLSMARVYQSAIECQAENARRAPRPSVPFQLRYPWPVPTDLGEADLVAMPVADYRRALRNSSHIAALEAENADLARRLADAENREASRRATAYIGPILDNPPTEGETQPEPDTCGFGDPAPKAFTPPPSAEPTKPALPGRALRHGWAR